MEQLGERVANLEAHLESLHQDRAEIRQSVVRLEGRIDRLEDKMERRFESVEAGLRTLGAEMHTQFRWLVAGIGGAALTVIVAMFAKELLGR